MRSLLLLLISAIVTMSCMEYKSSYPKRVSGTKDAKPAVDPDDGSDPDPEVVNGDDEDDPKVDPVDPVEPEVKPCMVPESKKGQIF